MYQRIQASKKKEGGFTLIELLIVVVILGILAAVVIFASAGFRNKGAAESCKTTVASVKTAAEAFHVDSPTAVYPDVFADLTTAGAAVLGSGPYFELNGILSSATGAAGVPTTISGKGWTFTWEAGSAAPVTTPPTVGACVIP
jgi:prepilin-type N-terminal cleavage/methylation domain-containing protein